MHFEYLFMHEHYRYIKLSTANHILQVAEYGYTEMSSQPTPITLTKGDKHLQQNGQ